jgi:hypothetical protein
MTDQAEQIGAEPQDLSAREWDAGALEVSVLRAEITECGILSRLVQG